MPLAFETEVESKAVGKICISEHDVDKIEASLDEIERRVHAAKLCHAVGGPRHIFRIAYSCLGMRVPA
jgi:hypothetical protein